MQQPIQDIHWQQNGQTDRGVCLIEIGHRISVELTGSITSDVPDDEVQRAAELILAAPALAKLLARIEPHLGAVICYASTTGEHDPNAIAADITGWLGHLRDCGALPANAEV